LSDAWSSGWKLVSTIITTGMMKMMPMIQAAIPATMDPALPFLTLPGIGDAEVVEAMVADVITHSLL
jgi:hypothetical protein